MVKRRKSSLAVTKEPEHSASDSEPESRRPPKKLAKRNSAKFSNTPIANSTLQDGSSPRMVKFTSTPYGNGNSSFQLDGPPTLTSSAIESPNTPGRKSTTNAKADSSAYFNSFTSLMQSFSMLSDDEDNLPTVSQLAVKTPGTPGAPKQQTVISGKNIVYLHRKNPSVDFSPDQIVSVPVPLKNQEIVILQHKSSLTLHGYIKVTVLVGSVSILGYIVKEGESVQVFSNSRAGKKRIETRSAVHISTRDALFQKLKDIVKSTPKEDASKKQDAKNDSKKLDTKLDDTLSKYMEHIGATTVVVLLERCILPPRLQFLQLYLPIAVDADLPEHCVKNKSMCSTQTDIITVSSEYETTAEQLKALIDLKENGSLPIRVLVHGPKNSGKSSLLRYLIHTVLNNKQSNVYYLDTDPGQTEFSPPGCVSLTKVAAPLLEPPYCHDIDPEEIIFTGSSTPSASPSMYMDCVRDLVRKFDAKHKDAILFINTMGWVEGVGKVCFENLYAVAKPTLLVDFVLPKDCPLFNISRGDEGCIVVQIPIGGFTPAPNAYSPKELRSFALMSYLGKCQKYYLPPTHINSIQPVCISWDDLAIYIMKRVPDRHMISAIQCGFVALCHVEDDQILVSVADDGRPKTLKSEPKNECLGFGFVRAADEQNHLLYIVTPLSLDQLHRVNALIKGDINVPDEVFLKQPITDVELPFTNESKFAPASIQRSVKKRQFIPQTPRNC